MEKLELHEIVGYLPYGLKGNLENIEYYDSVINQELFRIETGKTNIVNDSDPYVIVGDIEAQLRDFKPILRPLSDLTKEIKVNGKKFVPLHKLLQAYCFNIDKMDLEEINSYSESLIEIDMSHQTAVILYSWHFDIHNLINRGLAIDINTIK